MWREERNFKIEVVVGILVIASFFFVDFSAVERAVLALCVVLVLTAEIVNTAIEDLCNKVEPGFDAVIGTIKDMMAAYVLVSCLGAVIVGISIYTAHFMPAVIH